VPYVLVAWRRFAERIDHSAEGPLASAPRYLRDPKPTHLVLGREAT
jgi:hypothetical protein